MVTQHFILKTVGTPIFTFHFLKNKIVMLFQLANKMGFMAFRMKLKLKCQYYISRLMDMIQKDY